MKLGIILNTADPETAWNALRLGAKAIEKGNNASLFLIGSGVEIEGISDGRFDIAGTLKGYLEKGGELLACGTCLKVRQQEGGVSLQRVQHLRAVKAERKLRIAAQRYRSCGTGTV